MKRGALLAGVAALAVMSGAAPPAGADDTDTSCVTAAPATPTTAGRVAFAGRPGMVPVTGATFYVAPDGNDAWSGRLRQANADRSDGPFASIEAGRDAVRATGAPGRVVVTAGSYHLARTIRFDKRDAGLVITGEAGAPAVLHGGPRITGWLPADDGLWQAELPGGEVVAALFVDGIAQIPARYPDAPADGDPQEGWLFADEPAPGTDAWQGNTEFRYRDGDLPALDDITGLVVDIVGGFNPGSQWGSDTLPVVSIDTAGRTIHTRGTGYFFTGTGSRYFLTGLAAFLDAPREWWYDAAARRIDLVADGIDPDAADIVAGVLPTLFELDGADGMVIAGLTLRDGSPAGTGKLGTDTRGGGAIRVIGSDRVRILDNVIANIGVGVHVAESLNVLVAGNEIGPVAGTGIYLGTVYGSFGRSDGAEIVGNHIHDIGQVYLESAGIFFQAADHVAIRQNLIEDAAQFGIAGGSIWGVQDSVHDALVEGNEVRDANRSTADGGAIKMMGEQGDLQRTTIRANRVTGTRQLMNRPDGSFWPTDYENVGEWPTPISWAIYTDGKASGIRVEGNILDDNVTAIGINGGWNNLVTGNTISGGSGTAFRIDDGTGRDWNPPFAEPNRIEDNTISIRADAGPAVSVYAPGHGAGYVRFARNRYCGSLDRRSFDIRPEIMASGRFGSLADLQAAGGETGSTAPEPPPRFRLFGGPR